MDCQKEKKRMPLTQRNLGTGLGGVNHACQSVQTERRLPERFQVLVNTHPEYGETPECETYRNVVHDGHIQVSTASAKVAFVVGTSSFHNQTRERKKRLDLDIFCVQLSRQMYWNGAAVVRRMPRLRKRNVYGSLESITLRHRVTGKTAGMGGRPCKRIRRDRSPPR